MNDRKLLLIIAAVVIIGVAGGTWWFGRKPDVTPEPPVTAAETVQETVAPIEHLVSAPPAPEDEPPLPALAESDASLLARVGQIFDLKRYGEQLLLESVIHRFVVIVDNLDRRSLPQRYMLTRPTQGSFTVTRSADDRIFLDERNFQRYEPFVAMVDAIDVPAFVAVYAAYYPLFQQAYEEIGYPGRYFNDRFVRIVDHLAATPAAPAGLIELVQPKVLYQFADPALERLSVGQKTLIRVGSANAAKLRAKLAQLRQSLTSLNAATPP